ncbi:MAG TPA: hypothetical protein VL349_06370 [Terriglobales bacterium]|nr:hypothetical protein [Terriglobales bacterium]
MTAAGAQKILLLHPADDPSRFLARYKWDLVADLGRAPASTYEVWGRAAGCRVMSIHDLSRGVDDLHQTRKLLQFGMGEVVDEFGIDWWDVLAQSAVPALQQIILADRLAEILGRPAEIYSTRPHFVSTALQHLLGGSLVELQTGRSLSDRTKHYLNVFQQLDRRQFTQVLQDKFDPEHNIRRRFARRKQRYRGPLVLLPSAYVNVSRTAVAYAAAVPDLNFLLVTARNSGRLESLPANVEMESLDGYFSGVRQGEMKSLADRWNRLEPKLSESSRELAAAKISGVLANARTLLRWGIAVRNAWLLLYESHPFFACLSADDSNPYSRIPLILAKGRGLSTVACHHGALDSRMAIKNQHADLYLAKGEMERDYLVRGCQVAPERIVIGAPVSVASQPLKNEEKTNQNWLVFFTEPYHTTGWRMEEVYRDLLPRLLSLARECGLQLVFKLHPFESLKGQKRILRRLLPKKEAREIAIVTGPICKEFWTPVSCALTVQSTVAIDCSRRGIPIFLCGWLADSVGGYAQQFARFGVGCLLESPKDLARIPKLFKEAQRLPSSGQETVEPETLRTILSGMRSRAALMSA